MRKNLFYFICFIFIITGICYLVNEYVTIIHTTESVSAYYTHTISDLAVPFSVSKFSNYYILLRTTFFIVGPIFFVCYNYLFYNRINKVNKLCFILSFLVCVGVIMVGTFYTNGQHHLYHLIGSGLTFASANALILLTGLYFNNDFKIYKIFCVMLACVGIVCGVLLLLPISLTYMPIVERLTIYPLIIFEIVSGFYLIFLHHSENIKFWIEIK